MKSVTHVAIFASLAAASFNLDTAGPDWDYTTKDLANTTSQACKNAYSAPINCDSTLLGLVASMRPSFKPTAADLANTCTSTCEDSLAAYIQVVQEACTGEGDKAQESQGGSSDDFLLDPVEIVGQVFQYEFAQSCRQLPNGDFCYFSSLANADTFACDDSCTAQFYQNAHDYLASDKQFNYYYLISMTEYWIEQFAKGWKRLQSCGIAVEGGSSSTDKASA